MLKIEKEQLYDGFAADGNITFKQRRSATQQVIALHRFCLTTQEVSNIEIAKKQKKGSGESKQRSYDFLLCKSYETLLRRWQAN